MPAISKTCAKCGREIIGVTEGQFDYNWTEHAEAHARKGKK